MTRPDHRIKRRMMVGRALVMGIVAVSTSGCLTLAAYKMGQDRRDFERLSEPAPAEYAWAMGSGVPASGSVTLTTDQTTPVAGGVKRGPSETLTCEGHRVRLIPDTPHMRWVLDFHFDLRISSNDYWQSGFAKDGDWSWPTESLLAVRETRCGAGGAFTFNSVPNGGYLLMAEITPPSYQASVVATDKVLKMVMIKSDGKPVTLDARIGSSSLLYGQIQRD